MNWGWSSSSNDKTKWINWCIEIINDVQSRNQGLKTENWRQRTPNLTLECIRESTSGVKTLRFRASNRDRKLQTCLCILNRFEGHTRHMNNLSQPMARHIYHSLIDGKWKIANNKQNRRNKLGGFHFLLEFV